MGTLRFRWTYLLFALPAVALYGVFFIYPFVFTFLRSFTRWSGIGPATYIGFANYSQMIHDPVVLNGLRLIIIWALLAVVVKVGLGFVFAAMLRSRPRGHNFFTSVFFFPVVVSSSAMSLVFTLIYDRNIGLINAVLRLVGLGFLQQAWLSSPRTAFYAAIGVPIYQDIGFFMIIFLATMRNIPSDFYEAATLDGANAFQLLRNVTFPLTKGTARVCAILAITTAFKTFDYIFLLTSGGPGTATQVPATWMYAETFQAFQYGYGDAIAMLIFALSFVVSGVVLISGARKEHDEFVGSARRRARSLLRNRALIRANRTRVLARGQ